ncbi:MAG: DUF2948 family protein [Alphaproteobacteria bacterium TMED93]|nr:MAG: DUF2948 family protein [Alphaproteobacteria bacterium TMED93]
MKDPKKSYKPIKLRAIDDNDLSVFSDCIYQSILLSSELMYDKKTKIFLLALERFTWEIAEGEDHKLRQVSSILTITGVEKVLDNSIFFNNLIYNVLSITNYDNNIFILLNDNKIITLEAYNWSCLLEDVGKPRWPAVTPFHLRND